MSVVSGQNSETEDTGESHIGHITLDIHVPLCNFGKEYVYLMQMFRCTSIL